MTPREIQTVCFVGAGTMGCYNAMAAALSGYQVVLYDVSQQSLDNSGEVLTEMAAFLTGGGYCQADDVPAAMARIQTTADLEEAVAEAELVSESVFERLDIKRDIHRLLDELAPPHTILTTNSSNLLVSDIEDVVARGDRFAALHTHLGSPLVDIVPGSRTAPEVLQQLERYVESTRGVPLLLHKENPGYVLNAMLGPVLSTALALLVGKRGTVAEIDAAWMTGQQASMGPFGMMDLFGLGLIADSWQSRNRDDALQTVRSEVMALLGEMAERGEMGMKSGAGFYRYPEPDYQRPDFATTEAVSGELADSLLTALATNAVILAANNVVTPQEVDRAWKVGTWLPRGPFEILTEQGLPAFLPKLDAAVEQGYISRASAEQVKHWLNDNGTGNGEQQHAK